jgi:hypothetical protein
LLHVVFPARNFRQLEAAVTTITVSFALPSPDGGIFLAGWEIAGLFCTRRNTLNSSRANSAAVLPQSGTQLLNVVFPARSFRLLEFAATTTTVSLALATRMGAVLPRRREKGVDCLWFRVAHVLRSDTIQHKKSCPDPRCCSLLSRKAQHGVLSKGANG